mgnify:CR=1 FL=1
MVVAVEHRNQVIREVLGDYDGRIVLTALDALFGIGRRIDEGPAQLIVLLELIDDLIARVELAHQVVLGARSLLAMAILMPWVFPYGSQLATMLYQHTARE